MDDFIDIMTGDRREAKMIFSIRELCGLNIKLGLLNSKLDKYGLESGDSLFPFVKCSPALKKKLKKIKLELKKKKKSEPKPENKADDVLIIEKLDEKTGEPEKKEKSTEVSAKNVTVTAELPKQVEKKAESDELEIVIMDEGK